MADKLTHKEHDARALLLGKVYDWRDGTYCQPTYYGAPTVDAVVDAMSLEEMSGDAALARCVEWNGVIVSELNFFMNPRPETPYAYAEEIDHEQEV